MNTETIPGLVTLMLLAFAQNVAFSLVSRSRNRSSILYHVIASIASNAVWFVTFRWLVTADMSWILLIPYTVGTVSGSVFGVKVSMWIESWLGAESDSHIKKANPLEERVKALEQQLHALDAGRMECTVCHLEKPVNDFATPDKCERCNAAA